MNSFAGFWLSRAALLAAAVFIFCGVKSYLLNPRGAANRLAALFNAVFTVWAFAANFWYSASNPSDAQRLYRAFAWCWAFFPPLILHFCILVSGSPWPKTRLARAAATTALYAPAAYLSFAVPIKLLVEPVYRGGYWMLSTRFSPLYFFFVAHYTIICFLAIFALLAGRSRSRSSSERSRLGLIAWTSLFALSCGFVTDSIFLIARIDFPNIAIFWVSILSLGMLAGMSRFGFLSPIPPLEAPRILDALADIVVYFDESGRIAWANGSAARTAGVEELESIRGEGPDAFLSGEELERLSRAISGKEESYTASVHFGPHRIPVDLRVHPILDLGQPRGAVVTGLDLRTANAREKAERRLADTGLILEEFIAHSLDGILVADAEGKITRWNQAMTEATGIPAEEAIGATMAAIEKSLALGEDDTAPKTAGGEGESEAGAAMGTVAKAEAGLGAIEDRGARVEGGSRIHFLASSETSIEPAASPRPSEDLKIRRRDGTLRVLQSSAFTIPLESGILAAAVVRDVTEDRIAAKRTIDRIRSLDHAQKMDAVGALTSGIAHDFNNTLAGLVGALSLINLNIAEGIYSSAADMKSELAIMERSAERATSSIKRLLALTKKRLPENTPFRLDEALSRVAEFALRSLDSSVSLKLAGLPLKAIAKGDAGQIEQLILNLLINASHAMTSMRPAGQKRGGVATLGLEPFHPDEAFLVANPDAEDRDYWKISVRDEGVGIHPDIASRIFEPFFTTKREENSSGLGLAMVHSIARQHDGFVYLRSEPGRGTEFFVCIPASGESPAPRKALRLARGEGPVLIADDDDVPGETSRAMLSALGYRARRARSGEEAMELFSQAPGSWVAVVLDFRMGDMTGDETAMRMRRVRADLPIVIASGYAADERIEALADDPGIVVIEKPFSVESLSAAILRASKRG